MNSFVLAEIILWLKSIGYHAVEELEAGYGALIRFAFLDENVVLVVLEFRVFYFIKFLVEFYFFRL